MHLAIEKHHAFFASVRGTVKNLCILTVEGEGSILAQGLRIGAGVELFNIHTQGEGCNNGKRYLEYGTTTFLDFWLRARGDNPRAYSPRVFFKQCDWLVTRFCSSEAERLGRGGRGARG